MPGHKKPDIRENIGFLEFGGYTGAVVVSYSPLFARSAAETIS